MLGLKNFQEETKESYVWHVQQSVTVNSYFWMNHLQEWIQIQEETFGA